MNKNRIYTHKNSLIGQTNNLLCNFRCLDSFTKCQLFHSYCCSHHGCKLWKLQSAEMHDFHYNLLPVLTGCTAIFDELSRCVLNFINNCYTCDTAIVRFTIHHAMILARSQSSLGRNIVSCSLRYDMPFKQFLANKCDHHFFQLHSFCQRLIAAVLSMLLRH